jgi:hypothetical protein
MLKSVLLYRRDCAVSIAGRSYPASFFTWRQCFNFASVASAPAMLQRVSVAVVTADALKHRFLLLELFGFKVSPSTAAAINEKFTRHATESMSHIVKVLLTMTGAAAMCHRHITDAALFHLRRSFPPPDSASL